MKRIIFPILLLSLSISTFADRIPYKVASYGNYDFFGKRITIAPMYDDQDANDQEFIYYSQFVATYLLFYGAEFLIDENDRPDVVILLGYGVNKGEKRIESDAIYATVPTMTPYVDYWGRWYGYGGYRTEVVGYNNYEVQQYDKYVDLIAYAAPKDDSKMHDKNAWKQVWKMNLVSTDDFSDFHSVIPYMIHSAFPYFGRSAQGEDVVHVNATLENNFIFQKVKSGSICSAPYVTSWPKVDSVSKKVERKGMYIVCGEFFDNKTIITFYSEKGGYKISPDIYLQVGDQQLKAIGSENITFGRNCNERAFSIIFPAYPAPVPCDVIDPNYQFYGVHKKSTKDTKPIFDNK